ncbi:hypothetical protein FD41_GL000991 [Lentilactobacillus farraginis DSM 18382 = JCM 14108]|uniref:YxeA family protein n=1 Tax=Lentilactobacillus farraginis DSM 18382 = JCM 14108 TaxID=1423743 RepID=A0A0R1VEK0_9LACO|nr:hypothetical protein FD41_GL000991 [Lentilactobacillus farraginis DSM 18382 = JCM 14108]
MQVKKGTLYVSLAVIIVLGVVGGVWYHVNYGKIYYYGRVGTMARSEKQAKGYPNAYYYRITGYDKAGRMKRLEVGSFGGHRFVQGRYIKVGWSKARKVVDYRQVMWHQIPQKAREKLPKPGNL